MTISRGASAAEHQSAPKLQQPVPERAKDERRWRAETAPQADRKLRDPMTSPQKEDEDHGA